MSHVTWDCYSSSQDLIDKLSNLMDVPETEMPSNKYYEPKEMTSLLNTGKHFILLLLNISSLSFYFEEFSALFSVPQYEIQLCWNK